MTEKPWYQQIKAARERRHWSQEQLAEALELEDGGTVSRWERGRHIPAEDNQRRLEALFPDMDFAFPPPRPREQIWDVPYQRNPFFTGREAALHTLHRHLTAGVPTALTQAIQGLGGIGKTQIAAEYAYRYRDDYDTVLWLRATSEQFATDVLRIANLLQLSAAKKPQEPSQLVRALVRWLRGHQRWLLVLDNVQEEVDVGDLLAAGETGHIILTTRAKAIADLLAHIELDEMPPEEGMLLLLRRARLLPPRATLNAVSPSDQAVAMDLARLLGGLPLALELAGAYITETNYTLSRYRMEYEQRRAELLAYRSRLHQPYTDYTESVATTWSLSFQRVGAQSRVSIILLQFCAFLSPDAIPEDLFLKGAPYTNSLLQPLTNNIEALNQALIPLLNYSFIRRNALDRWVSIHRLVQAVIQDGISEAERQLWEARAVQTLAHVFTPETYGPLWEYEPYVPHVLVGTKYIARRSLTGKDAVALLTAAGSYWRQHAWYDQAEHFCQQALHLTEHTLGAMHPGAVSKLSHLAQVYEDRRWYDRSEPLFQRALAIMEQAYPAPHPDRARVLNALARSYWLQGKLPAAEPLLKEAIPLLEQALGPDDLDVANALVWLASIYREWGRADQAKALYQRALTIREQHLAPGHPMIATTLDGFAAYYLYRGQLALALDLRQKALAMFEHALGPDHPDVALCLGGVADTYLALAVHVHMRSHGHPEYEQALAGISPLASASSYLKQAEQCYRRALTIDEQVFGSGYAETGQFLCGLAMIAQLRGHYPEAEALYQQAQTVIEQSQGPDHPDLIGVLAGYAFLLRILKREGEAAEMENRGEALERKLLGIADSS